MIRHQWIFAVLTFVLLGISTFALVQDYLSEPPETLSALNETSLLPTTSLDETAYEADDLEGEEGDLELPQMTDSALAVGVSSDVPSPDRMPTFDEIPWSARESAAAFRDARNRSCQMLPPDSPVLTPLSRGQDGRASAVGRVHGFTVGLMFDPLHRSELPTTTGGRILDYLDSHTLAVQAPVYRDQEGRFFFGPEAKAAFFERRKPTRTVEPESLISRAVREFRVVGLYQTDDVAAGRTLMLAFRYDADDSDTLISGAASKPRKEHELLFLHLLPQADREGRPQIVAFATSDGRASIHDLSQPSFRSSTPSITATIRFGDYTLGVLPAQPIVTGIRQAARQSLSTERFRSLMNGLTSGEPILLPQLFDAFHAGELTKSDGSSSSTI